MSEPLTYGELMMLCEGHGASRIYERHLGIVETLEQQLVDARQQLAQRDARIAELEKQGTR